MVKRGGPLRFAVSTALMVAPLGIGCTSSKKQADDGGGEKPEHEQHTVNEGPMSGPKTVEQPPEPEAGTGEALDPDPDGEPPPEIEGRVNPGPEPPPPPPPKEKRVNTGPQRAPTAAAPKP